MRCLAITRALGTNGAHCSRTGTRSRRVGSSNAARFGDSLPAVTGNWGLVWAVCPHSPARAPRPALSRQPLGRPCCGSDPPHPRRHDLVPLGLAMHEHVWALTLRVGYDGAVWSTRRRALVLDACWRWPLLCHEKVLLRRVGILGGRRCNSISPPRRCSSEPVGQKHPPRQHEALGQVKVDQDAGDLRDSDHAEDQQRGPEAVDSGCSRRIIARGGPARRLARPNSGR